MAFLLLSVFIVSGDEHALSVFGWPLKKKGKGGVSLIKQFSYTPLREIDE